jgi:hypothetical protein
MTSVEAYVARVVAAAPPLTAQQRQRLTGLLRRLDGAPVR